MSTQDMYNRKPYNNNNDEPVELNDEDEDQNESEEYNEEGEIIGYENNEYEENISDQEAMQVNHVKFIQKDACDQNAMNMYSNQEENETQQYTKVNRNPQYSYDKKGGLKYNPRK